MLTCPCRRDMINANRVYMADVDRIAAGVNVARWTTEQTTARDVAQEALRATHGRIVADCDHTQVAS